MGWLDYNMSRTLDHNTFKKFTCSELLPKVLPNIATTFLFSTITSFGFCHFFDARRAMPYCVVPAWGIFLHGAFGGVAPRMLRRASLACWILAKDL